MAGGDNSSTAREYERCSGETEKPGEHAWPPQAGEPLQESEQDWGRTLEDLYSELFLYPHLSLSPCLYLPIPLLPQGNGVTHNRSREVRGSEVLLPWKGEWEGPSFPALCLKTLGGKINSNSWKGQDVSVLSIRAGCSCCPSVRTSVPRFRVSPKQFSPHSPRFLDLLAPYTSASAISRASAVCMTC